MKVDNSYSTLFREVRFNFTRLMVSILRIFLLILISTVSITSTYGQNRIEPTIFMYINDAVLLECRAVANVRPALRYQRVETKQEANLELLILEGKPQPTGKSYILVYKQIPPTNQYLNPTDIVLTGRSPLERCGQLNQRINESSWLVANSPHHNFPMPQIIRGTMSRADDGWRNLPPPPPPRRAQRADSLPKPPSAPSNWRTRPSNPPPTQSPNNRPNTTPTNTNRPVVLPNPVNPNVNPNTTRPTPAATTTPPPQNRPQQTPPPQNNPPPPRRGNPQATDSSDRGWSNRTPNTPPITTPNLSNSNNSPPSNTQQNSSQTVSALVFPERISIYTECSSTGNTEDPSIMGGCAKINAVVPNINLFYAGLYNPSNDSGIADVVIRIIPEDNPQETQYTIIANGQGAYLGKDTVFVSTLALNPAEGIVFQTISNGTKGIFGFYDNIKQKLIAENQALLAATNRQSPKNSNNTSRPPNNSSQDPNALLAQKWKNWGFVTNLSGSFNSGFGSFSKMFNHGFLATKSTSEWVHWGGYAVDYSHSQPDNYTVRFIFNDDNQFVRNDTLLLATQMSEFKAGYLLGKPITKQITLAMINVFSKSSNRSYNVDTGKRDSLSSVNFSPLKIRNELQVGFEYSPDQQGGTSNFRTRYLIGPTYFSFKDTLYVGYINNSLKLSQTPLYHEISIIYSNFSQKINSFVNFTASQYLDHYKELRISGSGNINYSITPQFKIGLSINASVSKDLPRGNRVFRLQPGQPFIPLPSNNSLSGRINFIYTFGARNNLFQRSFTGAIPQYSSNF